MSRYQDEPLPGLISTAKAIIGEIQVDFGALTTQQLNWKPDANRWSIAQCLDHLVTANESYLPIFEQALSGEEKKTFWGRMPWLSAWWGRLLIKTVSPETSRRSNAPKIFHPTSSNLDDALIQRFIDLQKRVIEYMRTIEEQGAGKTVVPSPVTRFITYSLIDACRIIVAHERRHLLQAKGVAAMDGFPN